MKYLIAGLGNIGPEYELTRHNIGFLTLDRLADEHQLEFITSRLADKTELKFKGRYFYLIKPNTYMNLSGKAIAYWLHELNVPRENLLIVADDIALPYGTLRMRAKGSAAGHNGLKNIEEVLQTQEYARLRMGIGANFGRGQQVDYVLGNFSRDELIELPAIMDRASQMILQFGLVGIERTMSQYNK
jgi:PTH1 family peptidyl-tRNA hydrolase